MLRPQLFPIEMTDAQISSPEFCSSPRELIHDLKQVDKTLLERHAHGISIAYKRAKQKRKPYFVRFITWPDGNWACMYDEHFRDNDIAPGQYRNAYFSSRDESKHFYHLETNTTSDLILHA